MINSEWEIELNISVSNIAWHDGKLENFLQLLESEKCHGVEIAPSKIWNNLSDIKVEQINSFNYNDFKVNQKFLQIKYYKIF